MKRVSYQLAFNRNYRIIDIALDAGFDKTFGQTPSGFRKNPAWKPWLEKYQFKTRGAGKMMGRQ